MTCQRCAGPASATYPLIAADSRPLPLCDDCADAYGRMSWIDRRIVTLPTIAERREADFVPASWWRRALVGLLPVRA